MELLERDADLSRLEVLLKHAAAGEGRLVLLEGEAGIGKTSLLRAVDRLALQDGFTVLRGRGAQLEQAFPHGIVRQLFEPLVRRADDAVRARVFQGAAALAAPVVGLDGSHPHRTDASFAANHGLYWLTVELSDLAPLCLLVDDVHWSDPASLAFFDYLARRVDELPILLVGVVRTTDPGNSLIDDLRGLYGVERIAPQLLTPAGTHALVRACTGGCPPAEFVDACHEATRGNPFFIEELLRALPPGSVDDTAVEAMGPRVIARTVLGRLSQLWPEALAVARAIAVLDVDAAPRHVAAVAAMDEPRARRMADALVEASLVTAGKGGLRYRHPILRRAVYDDIAPLEKAELHRRAAGVLAEAQDPDRAAAHLLSTDPSGDQWTVGCLRASAIRALARGVPVAAAQMLRRALEEPPAHEHLADVRLELGRAARLGGETDGVDHLQAALDITTMSHQVVEAGEELGLTLAFFGDLQRGIAVLDSAADRVDRASDAWLRIKATKLMVCAWSDEHAMAARRDVEELRRLARSDTPTGRLVLSDVLLHGVHDWRMPCDDLVALARQLDVEGWIVEEGSAVGPPWIGVLASLVFTEDLSLVDAFLERVFRHATSTGSRTELTTYWLMRMGAHQVRAELPEIEELADRGLAIAPALGIFLRYQVGAHLGFALVGRGQPAAAERRLRELDVMDGPVAPLSRGRTLLVARSHVHLGMGRTSEALRDAREAAERDRRYDRTFMPFSTFWSSALALHAAGAQDEAREAAQHELAVTRRFGSAVVEGMGLLVSGTVTGDIQQLAEAARRLEGTPRALDQARALVEYGAALRRANQRSAARTSLTRGMEMAHRIGADLLVERARQELLATGARPRRLVLTGVEALTASERRVASMAASGMSNTEIAQALFVTRKTVEKHLAGAYQKLGISSRTRLAETLHDAQAKR